MSESEQLVSTRINDLASTDKLTAIGGVSFLEENARRFFYGYVGDEFDHEIMLEVSKRRFEIVFAMQNTTSRDFALTAIRVAGMLGVIDLNTILNELNQLTTYAKAVAIIESIAGRDSSRIRDLLQSIRSRLASPLIWYSTTFALYERGVEQEAADELATRLFNERLSPRKMAQIYFRLAADGNDIARQFCANRASEHAYEIYFAFETICWYGCTRLNWKDYFLRHIASE